MPKSNEAIRDSPIFTSPKPKGLTKRNKLTVRDQKIYAQICLKTRHEEKEFAKFGENDQGKNVGRRSSASSAKKENLDWLSTNAETKQKAERDQKLKKILKSFVLNKKSSKKKKLESNRSATEEVSPDIWSRYALNDKRIYFGNTSKTYSSAQCVVQRYIEAKKEKHALYRLYPGQEHEDRRVICSVCQQDIKTSNIWDYFTNSSGICYHKKCYQTLLC